MQSGKIVVISALLARFNMHSALAKLDLEQRTDSVVVKP